MITQEKIQEHQRLCEEGMAEVVSEGPWKHEPHRVEFVHVGFNCLMLRQPNLLHWCGYVGVPPGHPFHGVRYDDANISAHGGLTYANDCGGHVCHIPKEGEPDNLWWFGFDCAHLGDLVPGYDKKSYRDMLGGRKSVFLSKDSVYRTREWVEAEVRRMAEQIADAPRPI